MRSFTTCDHEKNYNVPLHSTPDFQQKILNYKGRNGNFLFNIK